MAGDHSRLHRITQRHLADRIRQRPNGQRRDRSGDFTDIAYAAANPYYGVWSVIPGVNGQNPFDGVTYLGQALVTAPGPNVGEGLLGFAAMTALLIGARYRGLFV